MYPPSNPRYELIMEAARTVKKELSLLFSDGEHLSDADSDYDENTTTTNNNNKISPEELEQEVFFLRSCVDYFYSTRTFPFSNPNASYNFVTTRLPMQLAEFKITNQRLMNRYKKRLWKICKKFELLESTREQDAFELGNRLWGGMSVEMIKMNQEDLQKEHDKTMASTEEEKKNDKEDGDGKKDGGGDEGVVGEYPLLNKAFRFGSGVLKIPVVSKEAVEKGLVSFGEDRVKNWEKRWKELQIDELNAFLAKVNAIRHYAITLLDELQGNTDIA